MRILFRTSLIACLCLGISVSSAGFAAEKVGVVGAANPSASAQEGASAGRTLKPGETLYFNDRITTDAKGNAQLLFLDKSALTVGPNSALVIDKFVYNPADKSGNLIVSGTKGVFRFIGGALSKKEPVLIKTPVSTIGIRGGIAVVEITPEGVTNATFVYGEKMTVENLNGAMQTTTTPGSAISVPDGFTPPTPPVQVQMSVLAGTLGKLEGEQGTNGGATEVPDSTTIQKNLKTETPGSGQEPVKENPAEGNGADASDTKQSDEDNSTKGEEGSGETSATDKPEPKEGDKASTPEASGQPGDKPKEQSAAPAPKNPEPGKPMPAPGTAATTTPTTNQPPMQPATNTPMAPVAMMGSTTGGNVTTSSLTSVTSAIDKTQVSCVRDGRGFDCTGRNAFTGTFFDPRGFDRAGRHQNGTFFDNGGFNIAGFDARGFNASHINVNGTPYDAAGLDYLGKPKPTETASGGTTTPPPTTTTPPPTTNPPTTGGNPPLGGTGTTADLSIYEDFRYQAPAGTNPQLLTREGSPNANGAYQAIVLSRGLNEVHNGNVPRCTACQYADWGVWQDSLGNAKGVTGVTLDTEKLSKIDPAILGQVTKDLFTTYDTSTRELMPETVRYSGVTLGHTCIPACVTGGVEVAGATRVFRQGTFTADVSLLERKLTDFAGEFADYKFGFAGKSFQFPTGGNAILATDIAVEQLNGTVPFTAGKINAVTLFGPQAQEIGGGFSLTGASQAANGLFLGSRPAPTTP